MCLYPRSIYGGIPHRQMSPLREEAQAKIQGCNKSCALSVRLAKMGFLQNVIQYIYVYFLRLFENIFGPATVGGYNQKTRTWSNFSHEVEWGINPKLYVEPKSLAEIVTVVSSSFLASWQHSVCVRRRFGWCAHRNMHTLTLKIYKISLSFRYRRPERKALACVSLDLATASVISTSPHWAAML